MADIITVERSRVTDYNTLIGMGFDIIDVDEAIWCSNDIAEALDILNEYGSQITLESGDSIDQGISQMIEENMQKVKSIQGRNTSESEMWSGKDQDNFDEDMRNSSAANSNFEKEDRFRRAEQAVDERQKLLSFVRKYFHNF